MATPSTNALSLPNWRVLISHPLLSRMVPFAVAIIFFASAFGLLLMLREPDWRVLAASAPDSQKQAILEALEKAGIPAAIDGGSGAIRVPDENYQRARILLASSNLPQPDVSGYALLDDLALGTSRAVEAVRLRQTLETELAATIREIAAVESARVLIAQPEPSPFVSEQAPTTASVIVRLHAGRALSDGQIQSIINLVAAAVPGLTPDRVTVVDQNGQLLSADDGAGAIGESQRQLRLRTKAEALIASRIRNLLLPLAGPGNVSIAVAADLDFSQREESAERIDPNTVVREEEESRNSAPSATAGGVPGATSNLPPPATTISETPPAMAAAQDGRVTGENVNETRSRRFEIGRQLSVTRAEVGRVRRLTVAVVLRKGSHPDSRRDIDVLTGLVRDAAGYDPARGDRVTVSIRPFVEPVAPPAPDWVAEYRVIDRAPLLVGLFFALILGVVIARRALKSIAANPIAASSFHPELADDRPAPLSMGTISAWPVPAPDDGAEVPSPSLLIPRLEAPRDYAEKVEVVRQFIDSESDRATTVVRQMLVAEKSGSAAS